MSVNTPIVLAIRAVALNMINSGRALAARSKSLANLFQNLDVRILLFLGFEIQHQRNQYYNAADSRCRCRQ